MNEQTTTSPEPDAAVTAALPTVPQPDTCDEGYDWMEQLSPEWTALVGTRAGLIGDWPHVCVAHHTDREHDRYGIAIWDSGTVTVRGYTTAAARNAATDPYVTED